MLPAGAAAATTLSRTRQTRPLNADPGWLTLTLTCAGVYRSVCGVSVRADVAYGIEYHFSSQQKGPEVVEFPTSPEGGWPVCSTFHRVATTATGCWLPANLEQRERERERARLAGLPVCLVGGKDG